ncbi:hypothetical protein DTL21_06290 [Bremerella cremea]|uniref:Uncharacterized protein n=1 Tax=Blastopirellula marina TaxID=124 RepID=A0A2S8FZR1_9BACT|nr:MULTISPECIES: hypothetical protein [Pirellulaceae]PQO37550.1 hypothetical protein C5Y83_06290 [Blastopirellula marina]RCS49937.1 hypothetical protein DTL21_06290 [Bremerella cremea]
MNVVIHRTFDAIEHEAVLFDCMLAYTLSVRTGIPGCRFDSEIVDRQITDFQLEDAHGMHFTPRSSTAINHWARTRILHALDELELSREAANKPPLIDRHELHLEAIERYEQWLDHQPARQHPTASSPLIALVPSLSQSEG